MSDNADLEDKSHTEEEEDVSLEEEEEKEDEELGIAALLGPEIKDTADDAEDYEPNFDDDDDDDDEEDDEEEENDDEVDAKRQKVD